MNKLQKTFGQVGFTAQEKMDLAARLQQAAEQEEIMTDTAKRKVRKISRGMIIGIAAACLLTVGALAAALSPGLRSYFDAGTPGAQEVLESGIYQLNRSETYNGWTVALTDCVGDDSRAYIWVEVTAPEGTVLAQPEDGWISMGFDLTEFPEGVYPSYFPTIYALLDGDRLDHKLSFCAEIQDSGGSLRGRTVTITLGPIVDVYRSDSGTDQAQYHEGSELTEAVRDHAWVFEDVALDYPDQTIRLEPDTEVPYLNGTATLTCVEVSPLTTKVRIEGGACEDHHGLRAKLEAQEQAGPEEAEEAGSTEIVVSSEDIQITVSSAEEDADSWFECWDALGVELHMKDGSVLDQAVSNGSHCQDGLNPYYEGVPYVEGRFQYAESSNLIAPRIIDPAQVDYVTVCGVDIPMPGAAGEPEEEPLSVWQWIFKTYWNN